MPCIWPYLSSLIIIAGFTLVSLDPQTSTISFPPAGTCLLDNTAEQQLFRFSDKKVQVVIDNKSPNVTFHVELTGGGFYSVYFVNCERSMPVSFDMRVETYNLVGPNDRKDYLSIGESELDVMYWVSAKYHSYNGRATA